MKRVDRVVSALVLAFILPPVVSYHAAAQVGTQKWAFTTGAGVYSSPAIGPDGTIYVGSNDNEYYAVDDDLYAINPNGTLNWAFNTVGSVFSSPAIGPDGTIYVGSDDHKLYAINGDSGELANSPWPMFHHDTRHTGQGNQTDAVNTRAMPWLPLLLLND